MPIRRSASRPPADRLRFVRSGPRCAKLVQSRGPSSSRPLPIGGKPVRSCVLPVGNLKSRAITTIEGVAATPVGASVQKAWLDLEVVQCGYCQSGQIMSAAALLASTPDPDDSDIDAVMAGNICRCGTYVRIRAAIKAAASTQKS